MTRTLLSLLILGIVVLSGCGKKEAVYQDKTLTQWRTALKDPNVQARRDAADAFAAMSKAGLDAKAGVPDLTVLLTDVDDFTRIKATAALWEFGPDAKTSIPALVTMLKEDKNPECRNHAAGALAAISPDGKDVVTPLAEALKDSDPDVRCEVLKAITTLEGKAMGAVPAVIEALSDKSDNVRVQAAYALAVMGPDAAAAIPALQKMKESKFAPDKAAATHALGEIEKKK